MNVGIAGAGAIAMGYAALLLRKGHSAHVWSPSGARTAALHEGAPLKVTGAIEGEFHPGVCIKPEEVAECDVIILALPAYGYRFVMDVLLPFIEPRHTVIISAHLSFAALYLAKKLAQRGIRIPIVVWNTTVVTSKAQSPTEIKVGAIRTKVDMASVPAAYAEKAHAICVKLFADRFAVKDDVLTITLSNINPETHLATVLCNLTRIERGEVWGQRSNMTPSVGRLIEALDRERLSIAMAFGKEVRSVSDHFAMSFGITDSSVAEISLSLAKRGNDPRGPADLRTRYVLEDVPFGLIPTLALAQMSDVEAPLHRSGVEILSACYGRTFEADNDLLGELGTLDANTLVKLAVDGYPSANDGRIGMPRHET
jgi:opine dehydrogenase